MKQLKDFMPDECYGEAPDASEIVQTKYAVLTKLTCERGFWVAGCKSESKTTFDAASPLYTTLSPRLYSGDAQEAEDLLKILSPVPTPHRAAQYMEKSKERRKNAPEKTTSARGESGTGSDRRCPGTGSSCESKTSSKKAQFEENENSGNREVEK